jgi:hypothetical protein
MKNARQLALIGILPSLAAGALSKGLLSGELQLIPAAGIKNYYTHQFTP